MKNCSKFKIIWYLRCSIYHCFVSFIVNIFFFLISFRFLVRLLLYVWKTVCFISFYLNKIMIIVTLSKHLNTPHNRLFLRQVIWFPCLCLEIVMFSYLSQIIGKTAKGRKFSKLINYHWSNYCSSSYSIFVSIKVDLFKKGS